jgi:hypothetical protein
MWAPQTTAGQMAIARMLVRGGRLTIPAGFFPADAGRRFSVGGVRHSVDSIRTGLRQCRSPFNGISGGRDNGVETARHIQPIVSRDKAPARKPASSVLFARHREISVCMGLRGGAGRTRTSNQTIISRQLGALITPAR